MNKRKIFGFIAQANDNVCIVFHENNTAKKMGIPFIVQERIQKVDNLKIIK
jgi:hypothetical protein